MTTPSPTTQAEAADKLPRFEGYSWRAINDEVSTYSAPELRRLAAELKVTTLGHSKGILLEYVMLALRRIYV